MRISTKYKEITDLINDAQDRQSDIANNISEMNVYMSDSEIPSEDIYRKALEKQITSTFNFMNERSTNYTVRILKFVESLQKYITQKYGSVDSFLINNNLKVKSTFADISESVGYSINSDLISDVS